MKKKYQHQFASIRREYGGTGLNEQDLCSNPFEQFNLWFMETKQGEPEDPTALVLSTVDEEGAPDSRVVLLKGLDASGFVFYTHYQSAKAVQLDNDPRAALNFYWPHLARQVRVRGLVSKTSASESDEYYSERPFLSQVAAMAATQSTEIPDRAWIEKLFNRLLALYEGHPPSRPRDWGGYRLVPNTFEFWQGRDNRLHDRIVYTKKDQSWHIVRLAP